MGLPALAVQVRFAVEELRFVARVALRTAVPGTSGDYARAEAQRRIAQADAALAALDRIVAGAEAAEALAQDVDPDADLWAALTELPAPAGSAARLGVSSRDLAALAAPGASASGDLSGRAA